MLVEKLEVVRMIEGVLDSSVVDKCADVRVVQVLRNLLYNVQQLLGVPSSEVVDITRSINGGMVLSPKEVDVVKCFANGWYNGDGRGLCDKLCYQDAFDLMARLKVDCGGVRDHIKALQDLADGIDEDGLDDLVQHFEDLNPGAVLKEKPASLAERKHTAYMLDSMGFDSSIIDVTTPDELVVTVESMLVGMGFIGYVPPDFPDEFKSS